MTNFLKGLEKVADDRVPLEKRKALIADYLRARHTEVADIVGDMAGGDYPTDDWSVMENLKNEVYEALSHFAGFKEAKCPK